VSQERFKRFVLPVTKAMALKAEHNTRCDQLQLAGGTANIVVRNTFLDVDDCSPSLRMRRKQRSQTSPASVCGQIVLMELQDADGEGDTCQSTCETHASIANSDTSGGDLAPHFSSPSQSSSTSSLVPKIMPVSRPQPKSAPRLRALEWTQNRNGCFLVCWRVRAYKLRSNDRQAISPICELPLGQRGQNIRLRIAIYPWSPESRNPVSFKSSGGKGCIHVKCQSDFIGISALMWCTMSVGFGINAQPIRGPFQHNFSCDSICGLPRSEDIWDFNLSVESESNMFPIFFGLSSRLCTD